MRFIDLTVPVESGMFRFPRPDHVTVSITEEGKYEDVDCRTSRILMGSHSGTHIDAPMHMIEGAETIDNVPLDYLVGPARVLRMDVGRGETIDENSVDPDLIDEKRIIMDTGWHANWGTGQFYSEFPVVTTGFADLLTGRGVRCIVVDLPLTLDVHNAFLGSGACQVENVIGLDRIRDDKVMLIALPLKIVGIDAAPARVVVIEGM